MPLIMFVSSSFNTYVNLPKKRDYHRSFVLLIFWFLLLLESYIYMDCAAKLVLFGVGFSFARPQEGETRGVSV